MQDFHRVLAQNLEENSAGSLASIWPLLNEIISDRGQMGTLPVPRPLRNWVPRPRARTTRSLRELRKEGERGGKGGNGRQKGGKGKRDIGNLEKTTLERRKHVTLPIYLLALVLPSVVDTGEDSPSAARRRR